MDWLTRGFKRWAAAAVRHGHALDASSVPEPGPRALPAYAALGRWALAAPAVDSRLELLVSQLAAELSGCRWCVEQGEHRWRREFLPLEVLRALQCYRTSPLFSDRDRAALSLAEAVARYTQQDAMGAGSALARARQVLSEAEVARVAQIAAGEHFFNPATGALGRDVGAAPSPTSPESESQRGSSAVAPGEQP